MLAKKELSVVILAAGKGTRMHSKLPKVLHKICGKEMLYYSIKQAQSISDDVCVVLGFEAELVQSSMEKYFKDIRYLTQDLANYPGTAGALKNYRPKYKKVLVLNGDMPLVQTEKLELFLHFDTPIVMSVLHFLHHREGKCGYGRAVIKNNEVLEVIEEKDANEEILKIQTMNAGVYCIDSNLLENFLAQMHNNNAQKEYYLTDIIAYSKNNGLKISPVFVDEESYKGVNTRLDLAKSEEIMCRRIRNRWLREGVSMQLPESIYIEEGVSFSGECMLENGVRLTGNTQIIHSHIKAHSVIEDSIVEFSDVGPLAHLRPKSELKNTHIGNFVEVKASKLDGVKAGHLSYIGDCEAQEGTNIGAGFITCNYDGKRKHKTFIGKNVFIGSDTQAVAPVTLESECIIGAGTTITKDVKKGQLLLTRADEKRLDNFYEIFFKDK